jgi:hypothetical protein
MDEREQRLVRALALMVFQFLGEKNDLVWTQGLSAGERAMQSLVEYGLMKEVKGCLTGEWTELGQRVLKGEPKSLN